MGSQEGGQGEGKTQGLDRMMERLTSGASEAKDGRNGQMSRGDERQTRAIDICSPTGNTRAAPPGNNTTV